MNELSPTEIRVAGVYEAARDEQRRHLVEVKRHRRVTLNDTISLVFENHETVRGVVEEVVRADHIRGDAEIAAEVDAFNAIVPKDGELSACLYIEVGDAADLAQRARELRSIERSVWISVDGERISAYSEEIDVEAEAPAMYHLRFAPTQSQRDAWRNGATVVVGCDHDSCHGRVELSEEQRNALVADL